VLGLGWGSVAGALAAVAVKHRFFLPPYLALVARSLSTLEGVALQADRSFRVLPAALPSLGARLLRSPRPRHRRALRALLLDSSGRIKPAVLRVLCSEARDRLSLWRSLAEDATHLSMPGNARERPPASDMLQLLHASQNLWKVALRADLAGIARQLCARQALPLRELAALWLSARWSVPRSGSRNEPQSAGPAQRPPYRMLMRRLWTQSPLRFVQFVFCIALILMSSVWRLLLVKIEQRKTRRSGKPMHCQGGMAWELSSSAKVPASV